MLFIVMPGIVGINSKFPTWVQAVGIGYLILAVISLMWVRYSNKQEEESGNG